MGEPRAAPDDEDGRKREPAPTGTSAVSSSATVSARPLPTVRTRDPALLDAVFTHGATGLEISTETPGCAVAIAEQGSVVFSRGYGLADVAKKTPITPTTV